MELFYIFIIALVIGALIITIVVLLVRICLKWSIKMCESTVSMEGKVIVVTGANSGLGYHIAKDLAVRGSRVILACRSEQRGTAARDKIIKETGSTNVVFQQLDLSSLASVWKFADSYVRNEPRLDVLVNNAGIHGLGDRYTADGIVEGMQINYFGPFLLTLLLLPLLKASKGRIVNQSSLLHHFGDVNFDKINKSGAYIDTLTYANGKLCTLIFTLELARRLEGSGVTVNAVHPGMIKTNIASNSSWSIRVLVTLCCWICCRTPEQGAQTAIFLAVAEECASVSGQYYVDFKPRYISSKARNAQLAGTLWEFSERLLGYSYKESNCVL